MNKNMLLNNVCMDTQTAFFMNGDINIYPCPYEQGKAPITSESKASYRGRITVMENGNTNVRAYRIGVMPPVYTVIFSTEHCDVLRTRKGKIIERWRFDKKVPLHEIWLIRKRERVQVDAFFMSLK